MSGLLEQNTDSSKENTGDDSVVCKICNLKLKKNRYLEPHVLQVHEGTKEYECIEIGCTVCYFVK